MNSLASLVPLLLIVIAAVVVGWFLLAGRHSPEESKWPEGAGQPLPNSTAAAFKPRRKPAPASGHTLQIDRDPDRTIFWCDGVPYGSLEEIPDSEAREHAREMLARDASRREEPAVVELTVHLVVNGVTYNSLDEIENPEVRQAVMDRLSRQPDHIAPP